MDRNAALAAFQRALQNPSDEEDQGWEEAVNWVTNFSSHVLHAEHVPAETERATNFGLYHSAASAA